MLGVAITITLDYHSSHSELLLNDVHEKSLTVM
jgi:hypothetical protein